MKPRILVPYDFSPAADLALAWAKDYHHVAGGTLHVVHVVKTAHSSVMAMPNDGGASSDEVQALRQKLNKLLEERRVTGTLELLLSASPSVAILASANEHNATLIVMGTEGRSGLERLALGSVADFLVRNAKCPVLTVRAH
jgi:universal stress protein A